MKKYFLFVLFIVSAAGQCIGSGCPGTSGSGGSGTVTSVVATSPLTGGTITTTGSIGLPTALALQPAIYYCATSAYSDPTYTCTTGASLSTVPPTGTLILVDMLQACTDISTNALGIDSLTAKTMTWPNGNIMKGLYCSSGASRVLLYLTKLSSSNFNLSIIAQNNVEPICTGISGGVNYNNSLTLGCDQNLTVSNSNNFTGMIHIKGSSPTPTIVAGTGDGVSPTLTLGSGSNDLGGTISIVTGTGVTPGTPSTVAVMTFGTTWSAAPFCTLTAGNTITSSTMAIIFPSSTTGALTINVGSVNLQSSSTYLLNYHCSQ